MPDGGWVWARHSGGVWKVPAERPREALDVVRILLKSRKQRLLRRALDERPGSSCGHQTREARIGTSASQLGPSPHRQGGARTPEGSRGRGVGFVELDVSASGARAAQCVIGIVFGCIQNDAESRQPDDELIVDARFASVPGRDDPIDVAEQVRPGRAANVTGTRRPAVGVVARVDLDVRRDAGPVDVQAYAVVDVLQMPPGRRAVLASASDAEIRLGAGVADDETAAGQKVAHPGIRGAAGERQRERRDSKRITRPNSTHCYSSIRIEMSRSLPS